MEDEDDDGDATGEIGFVGLTSHLWPIRFKPLFDELLSCWLIRLAHGQGLRVQTFCNLLFGHLRQVWNRDIDRLGPRWLIDELIKGTGTPAEIADHTTLYSFEGTLFPKMKASGGLPWVLPLLVNHRMRGGFGQQYCVSCLREDKVPYFRKMWRLAISTYCSRHRCMLRDRCMACGASVNFHRLGMGKNTNFDRPLSLCHACGHDMSTDEPIALVERAGDADALIALLVADVERAATGGRSESADRLKVIHHFLRLLLSSTKKVRLHEFVCDALGQPPIDLPSNRRLGIEQFGLVDRHRLLEQAAWLLADFPGRIRQAHARRMIRYSHLKKDMDELPPWYAAAIAEFDRGW